MAHELYVSREIKKIRGTMHEVTRYLSYAEKRIPFGSCGKCLHKRYRIKNIEMFLAIIFFAFLYGFGGWTISFLILRNIYPPWNLPVSLDFIIGGIVALIVILLFSVKVYGREKKFKHDDPLEWSAMLAKNTLQKRERKRNRAINKVSGGDIRIFVYAPKEYEKAKESGIKPV